MIKLLKQNEKGQSLVEFAFILLPLLLILLGIMEFGWLFSGQIVVTGAAREGARVAAVGGSGEDIDAAVNRHIEGGLDFNSVSTQVDYGEENVQVVVNALINPLVGFFLQGPLEISAQAVMRRE